MQQYEVILADPPWPFRVWNRDTGSGRSAESHYRTMPLDEICALPVQRLAAKNYALFLWSVWPSVFDAKLVIDAWGFKYKTLGFEWWKLLKRWERKTFALGGLFPDYHLVERMFHFGMGYYSRCNSEPCLLATRGSMPVSVHNERNFIIAPVREHSQKPEEQYGKIERLYPGARYIELFARKPRPGWVSLGQALDGRGLQEAIYDVCSLPNGTGFSDGT